MFYSLSLSGSDSSEEEQLSWSTGIMSRLWLMWVVMTSGNFCQENHLSDHFRGASHSLLGAMCVRLLKLHSFTYVSPSSHVLSSLGAQTDKVVDCWSLFLSFFFLWLGVTSSCILLLEEHVSCCIHGSYLRLAIYIQPAKLSRAVINLDYISVDSPNVANAVYYVLSLTINVRGRSLPLRTWCEVTTCESVQCCNITTYYWTHCLCKFRNIEFSSRVIST